MYKKAFADEEDLTGFVNKYGVSVVSITCDTNGIFILFYRHPYEIIR